MRFASKSLLFALIVASAIGIVPSAVAHSLAPASTVTTNVASRVRSGPDTGYTYLATLDANTTVPVTGRNAAQTWLYIEYRPGAQGWVASWLVTPNGDLASLPVAGSGASAQPPANNLPASGITARTISPANLRPQPNTSQPPITLLPAGTTLQVLGRNASATWIAVSYQGQQGWVAAFLLALSSGRPGDLPIIGLQPPPPAPAAPVTSGYAGYVHNVGPQARQIFLAGQGLGNRAGAFSKIGDSISASWAFLGKIGEGIYDLHEYAYLQPAINYFSAAPARTGNSFNNVSLSAVEGWTAADLLDPRHAEGLCPGLSPLACEYTHMRPSVALIMVGTNDAMRWVDPNTYASNLARVVDTTIQYGVIPVLSTVPHNSQADVTPYNQIIISTANAYGIPWMDYYAASLNLPNHGNDPDGVHPAVPPTHDPTNFTPDTLQYGFTVRNMLALHMLEALRSQVIDR